MNLLHDSFDPAKAESAKPWILDRDTALDKRMFVTEVASLRNRVPDYRFCILLAERPVNFIRAFLAAITSGQTVLLPSNAREFALRELLQMYPDSFIAIDQPLGFDTGATVTDVNMEKGGSAESSTTPEPLPEVDPYHIAAIIFTSGSTGTPKAHYKVWQDLCLGSRLLGERLGISSADCLVSTVPPQHMFGFELSVLLPLTSGCRLYADVPFYPADIIDTLHTVPGPATLATTPVHLRVLAGSAQDMPPTAQVISSTAPLNPDLAGKTEQLLSAPLREIYGSTETGAIATRRTAQEQHWCLLDGIEFEEVASRRHTAFRTKARHLPHQPVIDDQLQVSGDRFLLLGRDSELVKVGGKRNSLSYLNQLLVSVPGVHDGVFVLDGKAGSRQRMAAIVVAPGIEPGQIIEFLRERIDPVFLPRPVYFVDSLPRNRVGKIPRDELMSLLSELGI